MTIQLCHHYLAKNKWMQWIMAMIQIMMLEDIYDGSQSHPNVNWREVRYKICDCN